MKGYDHWKTTNPEDEWLGNDPDLEDEGMSEPDYDHAECDCCGLRYPLEEMATVWAYGIETWACEGCREYGY